MSEMIALTAFIVGGVIIAVTLIMNAVVRKTQDNKNVNTNLDYTFWITMISMIVAVVVGISASIYGGVMSGARLVKSGAQFVANNPELLLAGG